MYGMLGTIWLILCVIVFGGVMEASGMIEAITARIISRLKSAVQLVSATVASGIFCNIVLSDQYMSIIVPGKMFAEAYRKRGYAPELLSRSLEDSATVTSVLVPWRRGYPLLPPLLHLQPALAPDVHLRGGHRLEDPQTRRQQ